MKKEEVEGDYRTLCSHTNACVNIHTYTRTLTDALYVHMKAHIQFEPQVGNFTSKPMFGWILIATLFFVPIEAYRVETLALHLLLQARMSVRSIAWSLFLRIPTIVPGKSNTQQL